MATALWQQVVADPAVPAYHFGTVRAAQPARSLARIRPLLRAAGITRLADVTGLDWVGIPVYQAVRPNSRTLSVSQGKGLTRTQAKVSALMEALEGFHAEDILHPGHAETVGSMRGRLGYDLHALPLLETRRLNDALLLNWLPATDLWSGSATWVPRQLCELDFRVKSRIHHPLFRTTSNGLCSGNTIAEALVHGLCEVIERDSCFRRDQSRYEPARTVALQTVSPRLERRLVDQFLRAGMSMQIVDMTGPTRVPCYEVFVDHPDGPVITDGSGCHPNRSTALIRALTEAAQSRATYIAGSRDDIPRQIYRSPAFPVNPWRYQPRSVDGQRRFEDTPTLPVAGFAAQMHDLVGRIRTLTGMTPMAVDLTRPDFRLPVLFVVAPGLWTRRVL
jgi:ribosomal protein S12 methylthiotransferase accessory factor